MTEFKARTELHKNQTAEKKSPMPPAKKKSSPKSCELSPASGVRTGLSVADLKQSFLFGLTAEQVQELKSRGYRPQDYYEQQAPLREALDFIASGGLSGGDTDLFRPLVENQTCHDPFLVLADYQAYVACQDRVSDLWRDPQAWTRKSILNAARMGKFSSDRSIRDYCQQVWNVTPVPVKGGESHEQDRSR